ncbi:MAG: archease [Candidatus Micrarchaeota archaeon]
MPYKFFDDVAIADVAFLATGKTIEEMFESAGQATTNTMVSDLNSIILKKEIVFELKSNSLEQLLHDFLQELIFYKDAKLLLFKEYQLKIEERYSQFFLSAKLKGEKLNMKKHDLIVDVKAVSWHMFKIEEDKENKEWNAFVVLDI